MRRLAALLLVVATLETVAVSPPARAADTGGRTITFIHVFRDRRDLAALRLGAAGSWFPQFAAPAPVTAGPTGDNVRDALPVWVAAFNHSTGPADPGCQEPGALDRGCTPTYYFRTFSQDGPARSAGGIAGWTRIRLPSGECGASGAIVDPQTYVDGPNNNNTINRIQLREGVPATFYVSVVTDNTRRQHDADRLEIRGNIGLLDIPEEIADSQVEPDFEVPMDLTANGIPDVYVFRVSGFTSGDYLKLRLRGATTAASFAGLLFDEHVRVSPATAAARNCAG